MREEKKYTERDMVLAKRWAFCDGHACAVGPWGAGGASDAAQKEAESRYPLPKVTRPRVVADPHGDGHWLVQDAGVVWSGLGRVKSGGIAIDHTRDYQRKELRAISPERVALWSDLLANPTEEVDNA